MDVEVKLGIKVDEDGERCGECVLHLTELCPFIVAQEFQGELEEWEDGFRFSACLEAEKALKGQSLKYENQISQLKKKVGKL